ncbi:MAG: multiheme c-type cytochrome [Myxococcota bacterium]
MRSSNVILSCALLALGWGCQGPPGTNGEDGADGADGATGPAGADGADGVNGQNGADGQDGEDGDDGLDGRSGHDGEGPWGMSLTFTEVTGGTGTGGAFQVGDYPVVTFSLADDNGVAYDMDELSGFYFILSGPTSNYQIVVDYDQLDSVRDHAVGNEDGTYTYTFTAPIPDTYQPVPNDTTELDVDDGDWTGEPLVDGTYTLAGWAYIRNYRQDGTSYYDAGSAWQNVLVGAATTLEYREVVLEENCAQCHGETFQAHGGSRQDFDVCLTCHVAGSEDRYSAEDPTTTPGTTVSFNSMIHKIHNGSSLENGAIFNGYPASADVEGYPNYNVNDFSDVTFPRFPMAAADCDSCHADAAEGNVDEKPGREACGSCHDAIDWATGDGHDGGAQSDDTNCSVCHSSTAITGYHQDPREDASVNPGLTVDIVSVSGGTGSGGALQAGDFPKIEFTLTKDDGTAWTTADLNSATAIFAGPLDHFQYVLESSSGKVASESVYDSTTGTYTYTFTTAIPSTFPAQKNNTSDIGEEAGDWYGLELPSGTYRVALNAYRNVTDGDGTTWRVANADVEDVLFGDATVLDTHEIVDQESCLQCHGNMEFHGEGRENLEYCLVCHTAGGEDRYSSTDSTTTPGVTIDLPVMIHKIHNGSNLTQTYDINGYSYSSSYTTYNFNEVTFPRFDGGVEACTACHGDNDAWKDASRVPCLACHDSDDAAAHAWINTDDTYGESCDVCHGEGKDFAVETMHDWLR